MLAELAHDNRALKNLIEKTLTPKGKRDAVDYLIGEEALPTTRACTQYIEGWLGHRFMSVQHVRRRPRSLSLKCSIKLLLRMGAGVLRFALWMRNQGYVWNHEWVCRICKEKRDRFELTQ